MYVCNFWFLPVPPISSNLYVCTPNSLIYPLHLFSLIQSLLTHPCFLQTRWITSNPLVSLSFFASNQLISSPTLPFPSDPLFLLSILSNSLSSPLQLSLIPFSFLWFCPILSNVVSSNPILSDPLQSRPMASTLLFHAVIFVITFLLTSKMSVLSMVEVLKSFDQG